MVALVVAIYSACAAGNRVIVSKQKLTLTVVTAMGDTLLYVPCCVGRNYGQKKVEGDMRTPEGCFPISMIQDSHKWTHDFGDGAGKRKGAYGPFFIRLSVPDVKGIGVHGTCFPASISTRDSEGCVRLLDADVRRLVKLIGVGDTVVIQPDGFEPIPPQILPVRLKGRE